MSRAELVRSAVVATAVLVGVACGGAGSGNKTQPNGGDTPGSNLLPGTAQAVTTAAGATSAGPYSCAGKDIHDATGATVGTCSGPVFDSCGVCPLINGVACLSSKPLCQGSITMPDGQIVAFSSNGCNEASCHASFHADGTALISVLGLTWKLSVSSNGSTTIQPHSSYPAVIFTADNDRGYESSDEGSSGSVELVGAPTVGAGYTLKVAANLSTKDMAGSPTISVGVDMTGVVTEVQ